MSDADRITADSQRVSAQLVRASLVLRTMQDDLLSYQIGDQLVSAINLDRLSTAATCDIALAYYRYRRTSRLRQAGDCHATC